jgi:hypothetical protein
MAEKLHGDQIPPQTISEWPNVGFIQSVSLTLLNEAKRQLLP